MNNKKAQILIVTLWILALLALLAISLGHRVSVSLKMSRMHRDSLTALCLAKSGINRATTELKKNKEELDTLNDSWADNEKLFSKIIPDQNIDGFAQVYYYDRKNPFDKKTFGVLDEERKININTASPEMLLALLEETKVSDPKETAQNILIWRGDITDTENIYEKNSGYPGKKGKFRNIEELKLIIGISASAYREIRDIITVYTEGIVNINTASPETLKILTRGIAYTRKLNEKIADNVAEKIINLRTEKGYFKEKKDINVPLTGSEEINIFNSLLDAICFKSRNFLIEATGNIGKIKRTVIAVYNRENNSFVYWHEN